MKEQILNVMNDRYEALDIIEINDLLDLKNIACKYGIICE